jgi:hypothetical protein
MFRSCVLALCGLCSSGSALFADPPVASYLFPAGGQRGTTVKVRVGGLDLHDRCGWELVGPGVTASKQLVRTRKVWFEGARLPLPDSQRQEDYPSDLLGEVRIAADAAPGVRRGRVWTAEGVAGGLAFMVGDLLEVVEHEMDGDPAPTPVKLPVTINGRIFPHDNIDAWSFTAKKGQVITCEVFAERIGSPLDSRLEVRGPDGRVIAENDDGRGADSLLHFTAPDDGRYEVRIADSNRKGGPQYVYRLTITADPWVTHVYPLGGKRGTKTQFTLAGGNVPTTPIEAALTESSPGAHLQRFTVNGKPTNALAVDLDDLPEVLKSSGPVQKAAVPAVLNGRIEKPGGVDTWSISARKGDVLALEMRGWRYGSPLRGVLEVVDPSGKTLAQAGHQQPAADPSLTFTAPSEGTYQVRVRDFFRHRGGPAFAYRLRVATPKPDFQLGLLAHTLSVARTKKANLRLTVTRQGGFNGPVTLALDGLPAGVKASPLVIGPGQGAVDLAFTAEKEAAIAVSRLTIRGTATVGGKTATRTATAPGKPEDCPIDNVLLGVSLTAPFKIVGTYDLRLAPRGTVFRKRFKIQRNGYTGPLTVRLADRQMRHLQGVTGPTLTVPAGVDEIEYPVTLPPWMETGRTSRACVMAIGVIRDGGVDHTVSFTSQHQNDQIIAVVETGRLGLELGRGSVALPPGGVVSLPVSIRRGKGLQGPVSISLVVPEHIRGLTSMPLTLGAKETKGNLVLKLAAGDVGPFNMPIVVRATLTEAAGPVIAESKIEIVPAEK